MSPNAAPDGTTFSADIPTASSIKSPLMNSVSLRWRKAKVNAQWSPYSLVHNIEELANHGHAR